MTFSAGPAASLYALVTDLKAALSEERRILISVEVHKSTHAADAYVTIGTYTPLHINAMVFLFGPHVSLETLASLARIPDVLCLKYLQCSLTLRPLP